MSFDFRLTAAAVVMSLGMVGAADAATVSALSGAPASTANPTATSTTGTVYEDATGDIIGLRLSPFGDSTTVYTSVSGGATATYVLGGLSSAIQLVWGSPDSYNWIQFFSGSTLVDTLNGGSIAGYVQVVATGNFDKIVIGSGTNAFEFGALTATPSAVPVPAAGLLLAGAVAGLGAAARRRAA